MKIREKKQLISKHQVLLPKHQTEISIKTSDLMLKH